jgi:hypothetical protein
VTNKIDAIVDKTIAHTRELLETNQIEWSVARAGLVRISDSLADEAPEHPALERLEKFIVEQDRIRRDQ